MDGWVWEDELRHGYSPLPFSTLGYQGVSLLA